MGKDVTNEVKHHFIPQEYYDYINAQYDEQTGEDYENEELTETESDEGYEDDVVNYDESEDGYNNDYPHDSDTVGDDPNKRRIISI